MKKLSEIAVTLFNLRDYCKTEADLARTLELLKKIGYSTIQVSAVALEPAIVRKQMDAYGMHCCATHESFDLIFGDLGALCDKMNALNCNFTALGYPPPVYHSQLGMQELARKFNARGKELQKRGIMLGYHNHQMEFDRKGGNQVLLETFYGNTDPEYVKAELDVQWVARGGGSPVTWIKKLANRISVIHLKDFTILNNTEPTLCEVGEGNLDWPEIIKACKEADVKFYSVEQDQPFPGRNIFDSMEISFRNLKKLGLK